VTKPLRKRPTQKEVAERAGVSQGLVSQVLNDRQGAIRLHPDTRERVMRTMQEMGYAPNIAARSLAGGHNHIMGVFTNEPVFPTDTGNFYYPFIEGIEAAAATLNYDLLLHTRTPQRGPPKGASRLSLADGTLVLGELGDAARVGELSTLIAEGHPVVFLGRRELPGLALSWVAADYAQATGQALGELYRLGHRNVLYLGGTRHHESAADREAGYRQGAAEAGQRPQVRRLELAELSPALVARVRAEGVTAVLIENSELAGRWVALSAALGWAAPAQQSFVVLGDPITAGPSPRPWAALRLPRREMGSEAVGILDGLLRGGLAQTRQLPCTWVSGDSLGPVPEWVGL
jgi:DNA-binding LacI/PurR family transcriptional regulator